MMLSYYSSRAASLSRPRLATANAGRDCIVSSMPTTPMLSVSTPCSSSSSRPQLRWRLASSRRAPVVARASRSDSNGHVSVTARWCLDARFGSKAEAAALLAEWATRIAPQALGEAGKGSFSSPSVRVLSGAVGASESRLEVEVRGLPSLAALEALWESLPREENRAWQERLARHVVDGSTRWEVFYELGFGGRGGGGEDEARASTSSFSSSPPPPTFSKAETTSSSPSASSSPLLVVSGDEAAAILQVDAATAKAAIEKSTANGSVTDGGASGSANGHPSSAAGRGRPRSLERAAAAAVRARAAAEAAKKRHPASSPPLSSPPSSSPPSPPPIKIGSILGATKSNNGSSGNGFGSDDSDDGGGGGLDPSSKLVPGQRLPDGSVVATDWKGDVMIIRPGDRGIAGL